MKKQLTLVATFLWAVLVPVFGQVGATSASSTTSFSLKAAVAYAVEHNLNSQNAILELQKADAFVMENIATGLPQINGNVQYNYNAVPPVFVFPDVFNGNPNQFVAINASPLNTMTAGVTASMLLVSGQYFVGIETAKVFLELTKTQKTKTEIEIKEGVIKAYYLALIADESLKILDSSKTLVEKSLYETQQFYKEGLVEELDVEQLSLINASTQDLYLTTKNSRDVALMSLKLQMGYPLNQELVLSDGLEVLIAENNFELLVDAMSDSVNVRNNIDYQLVSKQLKINQYQYKLQRAAAYPTLSTAFTFNGNFFNNERWLFLGEGTTSVVGGAIWSFNLDVPLFSSWNRVSKLKQLKLEIKKTENTQRFLEQGLYVQYVNAKTSIIDYFARYKNNKSNFELADKIRRINTIKYKEGLISSLDLTQSEKQFYENQQKYYQSLYDLLNSKITLNKILNNL